MPYKLILLCKCIIIDLQVKTKIGIKMEKIADYEMVDNSYESCCGLITDFAIQCNLYVPALAAKALYTGMITDSGRFRYDSTTTRTFRLASFLMEQSIDINDIYTKLYAEDFEEKKLKAQFLLKIKFTQHKVAYIYTTLEELNVKWKNAREKLGIQ